MNDHNTQEQIEQQDTSFEDHSPLRKIAFLNPGDKEKEELALKLEEKNTIDWTFWVGISLASVIATLGLIQNSVAAILGAMLIYPLLYPIQNLAFGITASHRARFIRSAQAVFFSTVITIILSFVIGNILQPQETTEILARVSPNVLDFLIAVTSGLIAMIALRYNKFYESTAGVAMAVALVPALGVTGIELALWNYAKAIGALFLYITNLTAIIFIAIVMFILYGYTAKNLDSYKKVKKYIISILLILIFLLIILSLNVFSFGLE